MAYNKNYNPDALPAHVEPEQAAALLNTSGGASSARPPSKHGKPQPPLPSQSSYSRYDDRYGRPPPAPAPAPDPRYDSIQGGRSGGGAARPPNRYSRDGYESPPPQNYGYGSPPPQNYGYERVGPPPEVPHGRHPTNRPPSSAAPPRDGNDRDALWPMFKAVDKDGSGQLSEDELQTALVNGDWTAFDPVTVRMMIRMFDADRNGVISFDEFCGLWRFLAAWRNLFNRFDSDKSGNLSYKEFKDALEAFGYGLTDQFVSTFFRSYDKRGKNAMSFDLFVQACINLKRLTDVFKKYDVGRNDHAYFSFENFVTEVIRYSD